jgi:hypothetical protein
MTTFVLVPGGFVGGWYWSEVADRLRKAGHRVEESSSCRAREPIRQHSAI